MIDIKSYVALPQTQTRFNRRCVGTVDLVNSVYDLLINPTFSQTVGQLFTSVSDFISSIKVYPFDLTTITAIDDLNKKQLKIGNYETGIETHVLAQYYGKFRILSTIVTRKYNNFLDFNPYTRIQLYLPFYGFIELDPNFVYNKTLTVDYVIDLDLGKATIYTMADDNIISTNECLIAFNIPFGATNSTDILRNGLQNIITSIGGIISFGIGAASGNPLLTAGGALATVKSLTNQIAKSELTYQQRGQIKDFYCSLFASTNCHLVYERINFKIPENYNKLVGIQSAKTRVLNKLSGYTVVEDIHPEGFSTATNFELSQIVSKLKQGIILPENIIRSASYIWNEKVSSDYPSTDTRIAFTCDGENYSAIRFAYTNNILSIRYVNDLSVTPTIRTVYLNNWVDEKYRNINISTDTTLINTIADYLLSNIKLI